MFNEPDLIYLEDILSECSLQYTFGIFFNINAILKDPVVVLSYHLQLNLLFINYFIDAIIVL